MAEIKLPFKIQKAYGVSFLNFVPPAEDGANAQLLCRTYFEFQGSGTRLYISVSPPLSLTETLAYKLRLRATL